MLENQREDGIASTTEPCHSQSPVSARCHRHRWATLTNRGRWSLARISCLVSKTLQMARSVHVWNRTIARAILGDLC